jgi:hypothetical protein
MQGAAWSQAADAARRDRNRVEALVNRCRRDAPPGFLTRVIAFA